MFSKKEWMKHLWLPLVLLVIGVLLQHITKNKETPQQIVKGVKGNGNVNQLQNITTGDNSPVTIYGENKNVQDLEQERQKKIRNAKIEINRMLENAEGWLQKLKADDKENIRKINQDYYARGFNGWPIKPHIERVNNFIKIINDYKREMDRKIKDILINVEEGKFENINWLKDEYQKYLEFVKACENVKNETKRQNDDKSRDEPAYNIIKGQNPYIE